MKYQIISCAVSIFSNVEVQWRMCIYLVKCNAVNGCCLGCWNHLGTCSRKQIHNMHKADAAVVSHGARNVFFRFFAI